MLTGFRHLDAQPNDPWPPARPRGVIRATATLTALFVLFVFVATRLLRAYARSGWPYPQQDSFIAYGLLLAGAFAAMGALIAIYSWLADRRPLAALGLTIDPLQARGAGPWIVIGVLCAAPVFVWEAFHGVSAALTIVSIMAMLPLTLVFAGAEEVIFRGWLMQTIGARHGVKVAVLASAALFALAHVEIDQTSLSQAVSVVLRIPAGLIFAILVLRYGNLWAALGLHAGWNACLFGTALADSIQERNAFWTDVLADEPPMRTEDLFDPEFLVGVAAVGLQAGVVAIVAGATWRAVFRREA